MNYREFFDLIKNGLPCRTFILHGEEEYVKQQAVKAAEETIPKDLRPFNLSILNKPTPMQLYEDCETLPFMAERRIVVCNELADGVEGPKYAECFERHSAETVLLAVFRGKLPGTVYASKFAEKHGAEVLFDPLSTEDKVKWSVRRAASAGVVLDPRTARLAVGLIGGTMAELVGEIDKLIDYAGAGSAITPETVSICVRPSPEVRIFDMLDMFTYGKPADGIKALHALMDEGNEPISISAFLVSRFKLMLEARRGIDAGKNKFETASAMEGSRYANEKAYDAAKRFTQGELLALIAKLSDTSYLKISGSIKEDRYLEAVLLSHDWRSQPVTKSRMN